jgi:hypothetical protein
MTREEFINREISTWGEDYIFDLFDRGYEVVSLTARNGDTRWSWVLTTGRVSATLAVGSSAALLPFRRVSRL